MNPLFNRTVACFLFAVALAHPAAAADHTVRWSGRSWIVRNDTGGPGPNTFDASNVQVKPDGTLHLLVRPINGVWTCAELFTPDALGRGSYEFSVQSPVDQFDRNVVLGLFSYPDPAVGPDGTNEIDIEFSRWGNAAWPNGNYTVYPDVLGKKKNVTKSFEYHPPATGPTQQRYEWRPGSVLLQTLLPEEKKARLLHEWVTPDTFAPHVAKQPMPVHLNLWLFEGKPPTDGQPVEVVLTAFKFTPEK